MEPLGPFVLVAMSLRTRDGFVVRLNLMQAIGIQRALEARGSEAFKFKIMKVPEPRTIYDPILPATPQSSPDLPN